MALSGTLRAHVVFFWLQEFPWFLRRSNIVRGTQPVLHSRDVLTTAMLRVSIGPNIITCCSAPDKNDTTRFYVWQLVAQSTLHILAPCTGHFSHYSFRLLQFFSTSHLKVFSLPHRVTKFSLSLIMKKIPSLLVTSLDLVPTF